MLAKLLKLTLLAFRRTEAPLYISPPRRKLCGLMGGALSALTVVLCITFTVKPSVIVTAPFIIILGYIFIVLSHIWRTFKYSIFYPIAASAVSAAVVLLCKYLAYKY